MDDFGKSRVPGVTMGGRDFSERLTEGELYWGLQGRIPRDGGWKHRERNGSLMHLASLGPAVFAERLWDSSADAIFLVPQGGAEGSGALEGR